MIEMSLRSLPAFSRHSLGKCIVIARDVAFRKCSRILDSSFVENIKLTFTTQT